MSSPSLRPNRYGCKKRENLKNDFFEISSQPPDDFVLLWEKEKKIKHHL